MVSVKGWWWDNHHANAGQIFQDRKMHIIPSKGIMMLLGSSLSKKIKESTSRKLHPPKKLRQRKISVWKQVVWRLELVCSLVWQSITLASVHGLFLMVVEARISFCLGINQTMGWIATVSSLFSSRVLKSHPGTKWQTCVVQSDINQLHIYRHIPPPQPLHLPSTFLWSCKADAAGKCRLWVMSLPCTGPGWALLASLPSCKRRDGTEIGTERTHCFHKGYCGFPFASLMGGDLSQSCHCLVHRQIKENKPPNLNIPASTQSSNYNCPTALRRKRQRGWVDGRDKRAWCKTSNNRNH